MSLLEKPQPFREGIPTLFESKADGRVEKYQASLLYGQSVEDLQNGEAWMDTFQGYAERIGRHQAKQLRPPHHTPEPSTCDGSKLPGLKVPNQRVGDSQASLLGAAHEDQWTLCFPFDHRPLD